jgi:hypothetical protein
MTRSSSLAHGSAAKSRFTGRNPKVTIQVHHPSPTADAAFEDALARVKRHIE